MNTNVRALSEPVLREPVAASSSRVSPSVELTAQGFVLSLAAALERLWAFYQAMHRGVPLRTREEQWMQAAVKEEP